MEKTFRLWAYVKDWIDGDTFHGIVDQGFNNYLGSIEKPVRIRAALINCPDDAPRATRDLARTYAAQIAQPGWYECTSYKPDPDGFGRPLLDLHLAALPEHKVLFSELMLANGYAVRYKR